MQADKTFRMRNPIRNGMPAPVASCMSSTGAMFSNIKTRHIGRKYTYRDITVEVTNEAKGNGCLDVVEAVEGPVVDEVLRLHEGEKLVHRGRNEVQTIHAVRNFTSE